MLPPPPAEGFRPLWPSINAMLLRQALPLVNDPQQLPPARLSRKPGGPSSIHHKPKPISPPAPSRGPPQPRLPLPADRASTADRGFSARGTRGVHNLGRPPWGARRLAGFQGKSSLAPTPAPEGMAGRGPQGPPAGVERLGPSAAAGGLPRMRVGGGPRVWQGSLGLALARRLAAPSGFWIASRLSGWI